MALKWARSESPLECSPVVKAHLPLKLLKLPEAHIPTSQGPHVSLVPSPFIRVLCAGGREPFPQLGLTEQVREAALIIVS